MISLCKSLRPSLSSGSLAALLSLALSSAASGADYRPPSNIDKAKTRAMIKEFMSKPDIPIQTGDRGYVEDIIRTEAQSELLSVQGVNLDEEAANLLRYQQAYEAAAQIVSAADTLFQSLLAAVRR